MLIIITRGGWKLEPRMRGFTIHFFAVLDHAVIQYTSSNIPKNRFKKLSLRSGPLSPSPLTLIFCTNSLLVHYALVNTLALPPFLKEQNTLWSEGHCTCSPCPELYYPTYSGLCSKINSSVRHFLTTFILKIANSPPTNSLILHSFLI